MGEHVGLTSDRGEERPVRSDDEGRSLGGERTHAFHAEGLGDGPLRVGEEWIVQVVLLVEFALPIDLIGADSRSGGVEFGELAGQVAEMAALLRSAGRHGLRIEEEDEWSRFDEIAELDLGTVLIGGGEVRDLVADVHAVNPSGEGSQP